MNYAKKQYRNAWLHHPTIGDPSFDTFTHRDKPVFVSRPPYHWTVNGSLFRDPKDGAWYLQMGHYGDGYVGAETYASLWVSHDQGKTYRELERPAPWGGPDSVMEYDPQADKYYMIIDGSDPGFTWAQAWDPDAPFDSGASIGVADTAQGPFEELPRPRAISGKRTYGHLGRFRRVYGSTLIRREKDWLILVLCDSDQNFAWGFAGCTAPSPQGPWSIPQMLLCCDRPEYYPTPCEFHPAFVQDGRVYANATSVAANRDYQAIWSAPVEQAMDPQAWELVSDGSAWHSEPVEEEYYGIWGQTYHGFVENNQYHVMFPSRNSQGLGTVSTASRSWDQPYGDGFVLAGHTASAQGWLYGFYEDFDLQVRWDRRGTASLIFDMQGMLGPHKNTSDGRPVPLNNGKGIVFAEEGWSLCTWDDKGEKTVLQSGKEQAEAFRLCRKDGAMTLQMGDAVLSLGMASGQGMLGLVCEPHSWIRVETFDLEGQRLPGAMRMNIWDGILGAGQERSLWQTEDGVFITQASRVKFNGFGYGLAIYGPRSGELGSFAVVVDGREIARFDQKGQAENGLLLTVPMEEGYHGVQVIPLAGKMALTAVAWQQ